MNDNIHLPDAFLEQVKATMPAHLSMEEFVAACKRPLRRSIRINTLKNSVEKFKARVAKKQWKLEPIPWCREGFWITRPESEMVKLGSTAEHMAGLFYIQEASSMMPVTALLHNNADIEMALDMASAPGSKTTQLAAGMDNQGVIVANEFSSSRVKVLCANIQRCGVSNVALTHFDGRVFGGWLPESFDSILLDAPCSGEGTIRKDPDAMHNWSPESVIEIGETQRELIESAFHALKPGGVMVYSTCTLNHQENQNICQHLVEQFGDAVQFEALDTLFENAKRALTEEGFLHIYPQLFDSEGFFVAKIRKINSTTPPEVNKRLGKFPFSRVPQKESVTISEHLKEALNLLIEEHSQLWVRDKEIWVFPKKMDPLIGHMRYHRIGFKLAETHKNGYRWQHEAIMALANPNNPICTQLTIEEAREWFMGRDIRPESTGKGETILTFNNAVIGLGKWVGNRIKNGLPRDLVRNGHLF